jgi:hypothetical protein
MMDVSFFQSPIGWIKMQATECAVVSITFADLPVIGHKNTSFILWRRHVNLTNILPVQLSSD